MLALLAVFAAFAASVSCCADLPAREPEKDWQLIADLAAAAGDPSKENLDRVDEDLAALDDPMLDEIAGYWKSVYADPAFPILICGEDDPSLLGAEGAHAFVVLGFQLQDGEMTDELKGRCRAAAAAAKAFPGSILVCSGGATGKNNPEGHTEAGLMKEYLVKKCGITPGRILTDVRAMTTEENAVNTFAMLEGSGVEALTIVTSAYHARRASVLYEAVALRYETEKGFRARITGNYCFDTHDGGASDAGEIRGAAMQLASILRLPQEDMEKLRSVVVGDRPR